MVHPQPGSAGDPPGVSLVHLETQLCELVQQLHPAAPNGPRGRGRPLILPAMLLWCGVVVTVLRQLPSQLAVWRLVTSQGLWHFPAVTVTDDAVYKRLATAGPTAMQHLFEQITTLLEAQTPDEPPTELAPFASRIVAIDQTTLDPVLRLFPATDETPARRQRVLPGKLAAVFDVRRQLFHRIHYLDDPNQNERVLARTLIDDLPPGSLILADQGYFSFPWFDHLTENGYFWISRIPAKVSTTTLHTFYADEAISDTLVWLGAYRADRAKHAVRLVTFPVGQTTMRYLTNVQDPQRLPMAQIAQLYARRWDIELAFKLVKRHLGLHLLWSGKDAVLLTQIWAVLLIAQVLHGMRQQIAEAAQVDVFDVSETLLIQYLPRYLARDPDGMQTFIREGRRLGYIRPSRRLRIRAPVIASEAITPVPAELILERSPRQSTRSPWQHRPRRN
jgi:hypothetical protein